MAKDLYHEAVKIALIKDGWIITNDPYILSNKAEKMYYEIDLGAEKLLAAEKDSEKIAVEVKSFLRQSLPNEFHTAFGQYMIYLEALSQVDVKRVLYLAIPAFAYEKMKEHLFLLHLIEKFQVKLIVFEETDQTILVWIK